VIEKCGYCSMVHDVGDGSVRINGSVVKTCPLCPEGVQIAIATAEVTGLKDDLDFFDATTDTDLE
jgi:hypothetical protein